MRMLWVGLWSGPRVDASGWAGRGGVTAPHGLFGRCELDPRWLGVSLILFTVVMMMYKNDHGGCDAGSRERGEGH